MQFQKILLLSVFPRNTFSLLFTFSLNIFFWIFSLGLMTWKQEMLFWKLIKMASKTQQKSFELSKVSLKTLQELDTYCTDCLYDWCSKRNKVIFCTMKSKGLFECRSCMLKMLGTYEREYVGSSTKTLRNTKDQILTTN